MPTLTRTLDVMRPHLPAALVSDDAFERARAAVDDVEAEVTNGIHFECRLQEGAPRVDLVIVVHADGGALLAAAGGGRPSCAWRERPAWRPLLAFCRRWTAPGSSLRSLIDHVWLEYDVDQRQSRNEANRPAPGVFCRLRRPRRPAHSAPALRHDVLEALEALTGRRASSAVRKCLSACVARLPPEAGVPYVGFMMGREAPTVRVCIAKLPASGIPRFLAETAGVGGPDVADAARLASLPDGPGGPLYVPMLHLDVDERYGFVPRVGMERQFAQTGQFTGRTGAAERGLLDTLTARGLCAGKKRDALLTWPGRSVAMMPHEFWWSVVERRVNHVKFVCEPGSGVETKGYLFARHRPLRGRQEAERTGQTCRTQPPDPTRC